MKNILFIQIGTAGEGGSSAGADTSSHNKQEWWVYVLVAIAVIFVLVIINMIVRRVNDARSERRLIAISTSTTCATVRADVTRAALLPVELKPLEIKTTADISTKIEAPSIYRNDIEKPAEKLLNSCDNKIATALTTACCVPTASFNESGGQKQKQFLGMIYTDPNKKQDDPNDKDRQNKNVNPKPPTEEILEAKNVEVHQKKEDKICKTTPGQPTSDNVTNKLDPASNDVDAEQASPVTDIVPDTDPATQDSTDSLETEIETSPSNTDTILSKVNDAILTPVMSEDATASKKPCSPLPDYENVISCMISKTNKAANDSPELHTRSGVIIRRKSYVGMAVVVSEENNNNEFTIRRSSEPLMKEDLIRRKQCYPTPNRNSSFEVTDDDAYPKISCSKGFTNIQHDDNVRDWIEIMIVDRIMSFDPSKETPEKKYFI